MATTYWDEQRQFADLAIEALSDHKLAGMIQDEFSKFQADAPDTTGMVIDHLLKMKLI